jgi:hypothetical protein
MASPAQVVAFWDYENVALPKNVPKPVAAKLLYERLEMFGRVREIRLYARTMSLPAQFREPLSHYCSIIDVPSDKPESVDKRILVDLVLRSFDGSCGLTSSLVVVLISSDVDFAYALRHLRAHVCKIVLIPSGSGVRQELTDAAHQVFFWTDVLSPSPRGGATSNLLALPASAAAPAPAPAPVLLRIVPSSSPSATAAALVATAPAARADPRSLANSATVANWITSDDDGSGIDNGDIEDTKSEDSSSSEAAQVDVLMSFIRDLNDTHHISRVLLSQLGSKLRVKYPGFATGPLKKAVEMLSDFGVRLEGEGGRISVAYVAADDPYREASFVEEIGSAASSAASVLRASSSGVVGGSMGAVSGSSLHVNGGSSAEVTSGRAAISSDVKRLIDIVRELMQRPTVIDGWVNFSDVGQIARQRGIQAKPAALRQTAVHLKLLESRQAEDGIFVRTF